MKRKNAECGARNAEWGGDSGGNFCARRGTNHPIIGGRAKAPSPLRFAGAVHDACVATDIQRSRLMGVKGSSFFRALGGCNVEGLKR